LHGHRASAGAAAERHAGHDGNIYFNSTAGLGRLAPAAQVTENLATPSTSEAQTGGEGITIGPAGNIWMADVGQVEQVVLSGATTAAPTTTALSVNGSTSVIGQAETLTASVTSPAGTRGAPSPSSTAAPCWAPAPSTAPARRPLRCRWASVPTR
jgi:hypothetical protein